MSQRLNLLLLTALLLGQLILLSTHRQARGSALESLVLGTLGPIVRLASNTWDRTGEAFASLRLAAGLRQENRELSGQLASLRRELVRLQGVEEELSRLSGASEYRHRRVGDFFVAEVVYIDQASWLRTLVFYSRTEMPQRNQPVVTDLGLVGRTVAIAGRYGKVLLLTDRSASVSAMIERTRRRGIVRGDGQKALVLDNIPQLADVAPGDRVVTAGIDGVFPRGIPIGTVTAVEDGPGLFLGIRVAPSIDLDLLDRVYVLTQEVVPEKIKQTLSGTEDSSGEVP